MFMKYINKTLTPVPKHWTNSVGTTFFNNNTSPYVQNWVNPQFNSFDLQPSWRLYHKFLIDYQVKYTVYLSNYTILGNTL